MGKRVASAKALAAFTMSLTDEQALVIVDEPGKVQEFLEERARWIAENTFVIPLSDEEAVQLLIQWKGYTEEQATAKVRVWRIYAQKMGYTGPVVWKVKAGFSLKSHAPAAGPCYQNLQYLQGWELKNDEPTKDSLVFWVPRLVEGSLNKNGTQMETLRAEQRNAHELPSNHCDCFGSIDLLFALILAHYKRDGKRVPLDCKYAASDTLLVVGLRLVAGGFDGVGASCDGWLGNAGAGVGFFLLGVEELGSPATPAGE